MADTRRRILMGAAAAAGAAGAFFGVRSFMRWRQQRNHDQQYQQRTMQRMSSRGESPTQREVSAPVIGTSNQPQAQPDRQPIPATGMGREELMDQVVMDTLDNAGPVSIGSQVGPLTDYLLAFNDMIERLRSRRKESGDMLAQYSLSTEDRGWLEETLDQLDEQLPEYGEGDLTEGSLQVRVYRLITKARDALQSREYTDADLFRINGEMRTEVCQLVSEMQRSGVTDGLERITQIYECGG